MFPCARHLGLWTCGLLSAAALFAQNENTFDSKQRIARIRELGRKDASVIPALSQNLSDSDRGIRVEAVKAIVRIGSEASLTPLAKAAQDNDPEVQIRATDGLTNYYLPGYVAKGSLTAPLTRGMHQVKSFFASRNDQVIDPDISIRQDVGEAIGAEVTGAASIDARSNAARAAGILRDRAAVPALEQVLRAHESQLILESLVALQKIRDNAAGPAAGSAAHDLDERVQVTALETVGILHSLPSAPDVRTALTGARNPRTRRAALEALAMLGLAADRPTFQQFSMDKDAELRAAALEGLGRVREPEDFPAIQDAYNEKNGDPKVHLSAAFALVNEGKVDTSDFSPLSYLVENLETKGQHSAIASAYLAELARRDEVRTALFPLVSHSSKDQKVALCSVFAASQSNDVMPTLHTLAKDIDPDVAFAASRAIRITESHRAS